MARKEKPAAIDYDALARECNIEFTRAGGPGGQHRNKTETAVRVTHRPSGVVVLAAERRSQARNKALALERLAEKLAAIEREQRLAQQRENRPATRPSRSARRRRLEQKRQHAEKKRTRRKVRPSVDD